MKFPLLLFTAQLLSTLLHAADTQAKPNILLILADDLGYGDVRCYNEQSKVATPHMDRLAREGMRLTDAHIPATVCTPTRYSLMTGQMAFRVPNGGRVFDGIGGPSLIAPGRLTLPAMLRADGYATACVGKWHVGLTFFDKTGQPVRGNGVEAVQRVDFSRRIEGGPVDHGFERFFGTACCPTMGVKLERQAPSRPARDSICNIDNTCRSASGMRSRENISARLHERSMPGPGC